MRLHGIDHVTGITADGQRCLDFYSGILGLAFLGRDRDFEAPDSHLLRLGRLPGHPRGVLSFIEAPATRRGIAGNGMAHLLAWTVRRPDSLEYWAKRLSEAGIEVHFVDAENGPGLRFADPEGLEHELEVERLGDAERLVPGTSTIPDEHAIVRMAGVRAYGRESVPSADILAGRLAFRVTGIDSYAVGAPARVAELSFDAPPAGRGRLGAGTIHHIAWEASGSLPAWRQRVIGMGCAATPVIEGGHCRSIYFREPSGVLFEIARSTDAPREGAMEERPAMRLVSPKVDPRVRAGALG